MTAKTRATRTGFTLVEILMVIAIIAILAALLITAVGRVRGTAKKVQAANDITQLDTVLATFKKDFGFYPPSHVGTAAGVARFVVPTHGIPNSLTGTAAEQNNRSFEILQRMFPRWQPSMDANGAIIDGGTTATYAALTGSLAGKPLDPNQCMVYFLGGPTLGGFEPARPYVPTGTSKKGPYFDFPTSRLQEIRATDPAPLNGYVSGNNLPNFVDPWGAPYAYFAASGDTYDARTIFPLPLTATNDYTTVGSGSTRPVRMGGKWMNPGRCQIMSAGPNRFFGPGSYATQTTPALVLLDLRPGLTPGYSETDNGEDDIANFNEGSALGTSSAP